MKNYVAIDIGASSGRFILGKLDTCSLKYEEIFRFENKVLVKNNHYFWDLDYLFSQIIEGLIYLKTISIIPDVIGIDTWGVDYVLLRNELPHAYCYRDWRTDYIFKNMNNLCSEKELFMENGLQRNKINSIYQLLSEENQEGIFLMIPDYLNYLLTGIKANEYTNMSTTGILNCEQRNISEKLLKELSLSNIIYPQLNKPGSYLGTLKPEICNKIGYSTKVINVCSHDTASAVLGMPIDEDTIYISSGTWSLVGVEISNPCLTDDAFKSNFTNEGGYNNTIRFLKNIMGLWIIQKLKKELFSNNSFSDLITMALDGQTYQGIIDVNDEVFLNPISMHETIIKYCEKNNIQLPNNHSELLYMVFNSLAISYAKAIKEIEQIMNKEYKSICIAGGGSKNHLLNDLTGKYSQKKIIIGPDEATAVGNLMCQMIEEKEINSVIEARKYIRTIRINGDKNV